jgi:subtilisin family serine protease
MHYFKKSIAFACIALIMSPILFNLADALTRSQAQQKLVENQAKFAAYKPGEIVVQFTEDKNLTLPEPIITSTSTQKTLGVQDEQSLGEFLQEEGIQTIEEVDKKDSTKSFSPISNITIQEEKVYVLKTNSTENIIEKSRELIANPNIEIAEPNYIGYILARPNDNYYLDTVSSPNSRDPLWNPTHDYQWNLKKINMEQAWDITTGNASVIIAVIDTGIDRSHPEFSGLTILPGKNYTNPFLPPDDDNGHGTHVTGVIASSSNNSQGVAGMNWNATILPLKTMDASGAGSYASVVQSIRDATDLGARVINMSIGFNNVTTPPLLLQEAIDYALSKNVIVVAAAGNGNEFGVGQNLDTILTYPAYYIPVLTVGATTHTDAKAPYSNYGAKIDVTAPGGEQADLLSLRTLDPLTDLENKELIEALTIGNNYLTLSGTSMAAPHVAGLAALLIAKNASLTNVQVETIIKETVDDLGTAGFDHNFGYGRINAYKALAKATGTTRKTGDINNDGKVGVQDYNILVSEFNKTGTNLTADLNKNGKVDVQDYNIIVTNFGK